jgi:mRNA-degrading endonuclease toxin of MazEF toxin-antitoxin module
MLQVGDIVLARFDNWVDVEKNGEWKFRPALVVHVYIGANGDTMVRVAKGTSNIGRVRETEFVIARTDASAFDASGLLKDTKFVLNDFVRVPEAGCKRIGVVAHSLTQRLVRAAGAAHKAGFLD